MFIPKKNIGLDDPGDTTADSTARSATAATPPEVWNHIKEFTCTGYDIFRYILWFSPVESLLTYLQLEATPEQYTNAI